MQCGWCGALNSTSRAAEAAPHPSAPCLMLGGVRASRGAVHAATTALAGVGWQSATKDDASQPSQSLSHPSPMQPRRARPAAVPYAAGCALVCIVMLTIGSIFVLGVSLVLPAVSSPPALAIIHLPLALLLVFNIC